ncbi:TetR/AcrR family transcriptional regulator [Phycobacter azelaicus]|jgi:AcrR family transcriptional regulator|uniref:TetR/AcrR family transcriptional regulator n=1 Tax=Phycobacter azelaicus TaxID=2668075 RepID=UPI0018689A40|nr:TetR/AcrR family transcriptional regulator [Phycobacter azelaicus]MBE1296272.1 TetR family transcriptional regulator [Paracoccaceae bacterium]
MRPNKRDELVRKALDVFYRNGFHATGMDKLVAETGVSKTSMYKHFRTKEELILAVLRLRDENFRNWLYRRIEELADTPEGQLLALFDALSEWFERPEFRGCMFIKASAEFQEVNHPIHAQSAAHKQFLQDHFVGLAADAGAEEPLNLARQLLLLKEGAIVSAVMARGGGLAGDPAADAKAAARKLIELHIQKS